MPTATQVTASDTNEDARSTSSTLVNGENSNRNETENGTGNNQLTTVATSTTDDRQAPHNTTTIRHGFDQEAFEEDIIRFLYYSEKRHDTNAKPHLVVPNTLLDWVS